MEMLEGELSIVAPWDDFVRRQAAVASSRIFAAPARPTPEDAEFPVEPAVAAYISSLRKQRQAPTAGLVAKMQIPAGCDADRDQQKG